jgi:hypothetical protein
MFFRLSLLVKFFNFRVLGWVGLCEIESLGRVFLSVLDANAEIVSEL